MKIKLRLRVFFENESHGSVRGEDQTFTKSEHRNRDQKTETKKI